MCLKPDAIKAVDSSTVKMTAFLSKHSIIIHIQKVSCCHQTNDYAHNESVLKERNVGGGGGGRRLSPSHKVFCAFLLTSIYLGVATFL